MSEGRCWSRTAHTAKMADEQIFPCKTVLQNSRHSGGEEARESSHDPLRVSIAIMRRQLTGPRRSLREVLQKGQMSVSLHGRRCCGTHGDPGARRPGSRATAEPIARWVFGYSVATMRRQLRGPQCTLRGTGAGVLGWSKGGCRGVEPIFPKHPDIGCRLKAASPFSDAACYVGPGKVGRNWPKAWPNSFSSGRSLAESRTDPLPRQCPHSHVERTTRLYDDHDTSPCQRSLPPAHSKCSAAASDLVLRITKVRVKPRPGAWVVFAHELRRIVCATIGAPFVAREGSCRQLGNGQ